MCGIIGYCGTGPALPVVLSSLKRLEYRGYDSAGVAVVDSDGKLSSYKSAGKLDDLLSTVDRDAKGNLGIGHTRWATHGRPSRENAHPHSDCTGTVAVVHNGIVENYRELKARLEQGGHKFLSQTDTEVIPHLIEEALRTGVALEAAMRQAGKLLAGAHAIVALSTHEPDTLVGLRVGHSGGLAVGYGRGAMYLASDVAAIAGDADRVLFLRDGEVARVTRDGVRLSSLNGAVLGRQPTAMPQDPVTVARGPYRHFMLKEIMEQPEVLVSALRDRIDFQEMRVILEGFPFDRQRVLGFERVVLLGMGTSLHAAMAGRRMMEQLARLPAEAENASEYRYRDPVASPSTLVVAVTQSGETVDTLVAMAEAKRKGLPMVAVCNVAGSEATRLADYSLMINAGPEIAVASTKTYAGSIACLYLLAAYLGQERGVLPPADLRTAIENVVLLPNLMGGALKAADRCGALARRYAQSEGALVLARGAAYPAALEGALKLKEISYIHAEGYPAGEMKHGPIALVDERLFVIAIALRDRLYDKMMSNIEEVKARGGRVLAVATAGDEEIAQKADDVLYLPPVAELLSPVVAAAPLQLLAYHIAVRRGCDVDQPRNLAKTVTVE